MDGDYERFGRLDDSGRRETIYPARVSGVYSRRKLVIHSILLLIYLVLPWLTINGMPVIWFDIPERYFAFFGMVFNAQDFYIFFFLLSGIGFLLIVASALWGRVWCGWACPQTVFLDGVFRRIEYWIEGSAVRRRRVDMGQWNLKTYFKKMVKHFVFLVVCLILTHTFLAYFVPVSELMNMVIDDPRENVSVFLWMVFITLAIYLNFAWFREQWCLVMCPYGRLQSALQDDDTVLIGYDEQRGEPRGKARSENTGDCVDCKRCVAVCTTGIDIRRGLQLECLGCTQCIDACNQIMFRLGRPPGLIRYDSLNGFEGRERRFFRPRVFFYLGAAILGLLVGGIMSLNVSPIDIHISRGQGTPFIIEEGQVRNKFLIRLVNKVNRDVPVRIESVSPESLNVIIPQARMNIGARSDQRLPVIISFVRERPILDTTIKLKFYVDQAKDPREFELTILGPNIGGRG